MPDIGRIPAELADAFASTKGIYDQINAINAAAASRADALHQGFVLVLKIIGETRTGLLSVSGVGVFSAVIDLSCGRRLFRWRRYARCLDTRSGSVYDSIIRCGSGRRTAPQRDYDCAEN